MKVKSGCKIIAFFLSLLYAAIYFALFSRHIDSFFTLTLGLLYTLLVGLLSWVVMFMLFKLLCWLLRPKRRGKGRN